MNESWTTLGVRAARRFFGPHIPGLLAVTVFGLGLGASPRVQDDPGAWSIEQWSAWRDRRISDILGSTVVIRGRNVLSRAGVIQQSTLSYFFLEPFMADLAFSDDPAKFKVLGHFFAFVKSQSVMGHLDSFGVPDHALGFQEPDRDYWRRVSSLFSLPTLLTSQRFLRSLESPNTYGSAMKLIEGHNSSVPPNSRWVAIPYRSRFLKSPDKSTYGRLFVFVPRAGNGASPDVDLWIQYALATPGEPGLKPRSVSVVAVRAGTQAEAALSDFMRVIDSKGRITLVPTVELDDSPSKNCYECHKSAVLPIHPAAFIRLSRGDDLTNLNRMTILANKIIGGYGNLSPTGMDAESYGPTLGKHPDAVMAELRTADPALSAKSIQRIREAITCSGCHGAGTVRVNFPAAIVTDSLAKTFEGGMGLAQTYVERGWMPPGNNLTVRERSALWRALDRDYLDLSLGRGALVEWLRGGA